MKNKSLGENKAPQERGLLWVNSPVRMVRQEVVERLREAIRLGEFSPGQRLIERELCEWTGVSRTSVREALRLLESEGLIENLPRRGPAVAVISPEEVEEIYDIRMCLEPRLVERFISVSSAKQIKEVVTVSATLQKAAKDGDYIGLSNAKNKFFRLLIDGCRHETLAKIVRGVHARLTLAKSAFLRHPERWVESAEEIAALAAAIKDGNVREAVKCCKDHLKRAAKVAITSASDFDHGRTKDQSR